MAKFNRVRENQEVGYMYVAERGLPAGVYFVESVMVSLVAGYATIVAYVVRHDGRLLRCWLS